MALVLGIVAVCILAIYSVYFIRIIKGSPQEFETELLKAFAAWAVSRGSALRGQMRLMLAASIVLEAVYFTLVFTVISNPAMLIFSAFLVGVEVVHMGLVSSAFYQFFRGRLKIKELFNWRMERISAVLFFTHCFLVLFCLIWG
ncbi:MAG TPA: hypothetical protein PLG09_09670 [Syntrophomonadaceae bacterium]|nr:hypothetical protein [Syntrophomonadaceae bacterium]HOQ10377.1 hypothetical protein [Syntrophomonadaceae bacterium]HPU48000.1 hypothetical protein [Syntrophomonadaceae bacterium]